MLKKGDIVEWKFFGSGGPAYLVGRLKCEVMFDESHGDVGLKPLDWKKFAALCDKSRDIGVVEFIEIQELGYMDCCQAEDCHLIDKGITPMPEEAPDLLGIREESCVSESTVSSDTLVKVLKNLIKSQDDIIYKMTVESSTKTQPFQYYSLCMQYNALEEAIGSINARI